MSDSKRCEAGWCEEQHRWHGRGHRHGSAATAVLVGRGRRAYLGVTDRAGHWAGVIDGHATLLALAGSNGPVNCIALSRDKLPVPDEPEVLN